MLFLPILLLFMDYSLIISCPANSLSIWLTESQNDRGWKGPLWVI